MAIYLGILFLKKVPSLVLKLAVYRPMGEQLFPTTPHLQNFLDNVRPQLVLQRFVFHNDIVYQKMIEGGNSLNQKFGLRQRALAVVFSQ